MKKLIAIVFVGSLLIWGANSVINIQNDINVGADVDVKAEPKEVVIDKGVQGTTKIGDKFNNQGKPESEQIANCQIAYAEYEGMQRIKNADLSKLGEYIVIDTDKLDSSIQDIKQFINANCNL